MGVGARTAAPLGVQSTKASLAANWSQVTTAQERHVADTLHSGLHAFFLLYDHMKDLFRILFVKTRQMHCKVG